MEVVAHPLSNNTALATLIRNTLCSIAFTSPSARAGPASARWPCERKWRRSWRGHLNVTDELIRHFPRLTEEVISSDVRDDEPAPTRDNSQLHGGTSSLVPFVTEAGQNGPDTRRDGDPSNGTELASLHEGLRHPALFIFKLVRAIGTVGA